MEQICDQVRVVVRYVSGHRAQVKSGWHPYGDSSALSLALATLLAVSLRAQGAEVRLEPLAHATPT